MARLFSYVVEHDHGFAPNPVGGLCTLAGCKFGNPAKKWRNIVEHANLGDWVVGTGGRGALSSGHGTLLYAMRVDHVLPLAGYVAEHPDRVDARFEIPASTDGRRCLMSRHFFYFGRNAVALTEVPMELCHHPFAKRGPGWRSDFKPEFVRGFAGWIEASFMNGTHGLPCAPRSEGVDVASFEPQVRRHPDVG